MYVPGTEIVKFDLVLVGKIESTSTSHSYALPISLMFSDGMMSESLYVDEELV